MKRKGPPVASSAQVQPVDVLFIAMPFGVLQAPSLGVSLLTASLRPLELSCKTLYLTMRFADRIGLSLYLDICHGRPAIEDLVGEWIFSGALFEDAPLDSEGYVRNVLRRNSISPGRTGKDFELFLQRVCEAREQAADFVSECCQEALAHRPKVVCFSSVFHQHLACLALARNLKAKAPSTPILFGGANCEGPMGVELVRQFPFVDAAVSGEGELIFPELVLRALAGRPLEGIPGVYTKAGVESLAEPPPSAPAVMNLDDLPFPVFDDYFRQWSAFCRKHKDHPAVKVDSLLFETSRGCWWGAKHHCTFCGLNGAGMAYRSKSAQRALDELLHLTRMHPGKRVTTVDNILDMKYFKDFIPALAEQKVDLRLSYEVKANLKKKQLRLLREAGIATIQTGIESLSTVLLQSMRKGVTALQNVQLLKWCRELNVKAVWNLLWGFPGESPEEYGRMAKLLPFLAHLDPPYWFIPVRLDRFSPYYEQAESFGLSRVAPHPSYSYVYSLEPKAVANLAYYFVSLPEIETPRYVASIAETVQEWRSAHAESDLFSMEKGERLLIFDTRPAARQLITELAGKQRALYQECDGVRSTAQLQRLLRTRHGLEVSAEEIRRRLQPLLDQGLMLSEEDSYLSLATSAGRYMPNEAVVRNFFSILQSDAARPKPA